MSVSKVLNFELTALLLLTAAINFQIIYIPFHGDEVHGLLRNAVVNDLNLFFERMITLKGLFQRPLSVLSYVLNFRVFGPSSAALHLTNLVIHLANVALVYHLAKSLKLPALFSSAVFAVHPLTTACVAQIYGRNYSLGSFFLLLALVYSKRQLILWLLMMLSKQVFIYFPVLLFWKKRKLPSLPYIIILVLAGAGFLIVHILPNWSESGVNYMLSQIEQLPFILFGIFLAPVNSSLIHELEFYTKPSLLFFLGISLGVFLISVAIYFRNQPLGMLLGCFLITYFPTNSFIPKAEVLLEWRLYPSLIFFALICGLLLSKIRLKWLYPLACAALLIQQNNIYTDTVRTYEQVLTSYPQSAVAANNLGFYYLDSGEFESAEAFLLQAHHSAPKYARPIANLYLLNKKLGNRQKAEFYRGLLQN